VDLCKEGLEKRDLLWAEKRPTYREKKKAKSKNFRDLLKYRLTTCRSYLRKKGRPY